MCRNHGKTFDLIGRSCKTCLDAHSAKGSKHCSRCKHDKPFTEFFKDSSKALGLSNYCKECKHKTVKASRLKNPSKYHVDKKSESSIEVLNWQRRISTRIAQRKYRRIWMADPGNRKKHSEARKRWDNTEYGQLYNQLYRIHYNIRRRKGSSKPLQELNYE